MSFFGIHQNIANTITCPLSPLQSCGCLDCTFEASLQAINHIDMLSEHVTRKQQQHKKTNYKIIGQILCLFFIQSENKIIFSWL